MSKQIQQVLAGQVQHRMNKSEVGESRCGDDSKETGVVLTKQDTEHRLESSGG